MVHRGSRDGVADPGGFCLDFVFFGAGMTRPIVQCVFFLEGARKGKEGQDGKEGSANG